MNLSKQVTKYKYLINESSKKKLLLDEDGVQYMKKILENGEGDEFANFLIDIICENFCNAMGFHTSGNVHRAVKKSLRENRLNILRDYTKGNINDDTIKRVMSDVYKCIREQELNEEMLDSVLQVFGVEKMSKMGKVIDNMISKKFIIDVPKTELYGFVKKELEEYLKDLDINRIVQAFKKSIEM